MAWLSLYFSLPEGNIHLCWIDRSWWRCKLHNCQTRASFQRVAENCGLKIQIVDTLVSLKELNTHKTFYSGFNTVICKLIMSHWLKTALNYLQAEIVWSFKNQQIEVKGQAGLVIEISVFTAKILHYRNHGGNFPTECMNTSEFD